MATGTLIDFSNTIRTLEQYRDAVVSLYKNKLEFDDHVASGDLLNNINYIVQKDNHSVEVSLRLEDYWKYTEWDTKPHFPPIGDGSKGTGILYWVKVKKLIDRARTYDGKLPTEKQLAYLIARKISERGTKGTHDLQKTLQEVNAEFEVRIGEAITQDINQSMTVIMTELMMK